MKVGGRGVDLIKGFEGLRLEAYLCPAGVLTIGYGHAGPDVEAGQRITSAQAEALLRQDKAWFEAGVSKALTREATQNQFDAMVSLAYNIGLGAFKKSTVLKRFNEGRFNDAALAFMMWTKAGGKQWPGLLRRRADELGLFRRA